MANLFENSIDLFSNWKGLAGTTEPWTNVYTLPGFKGFKGFDFGDTTKLESGGGFWGGLGDIAGKYGPQLISGLAGGLAGGFGGNNSQSIGPKQIGNLIASQNLINTYDQTQNYLAFDPMTRLNSARNTEEKYKDLYQKIRDLGPAAYTAALATDQYIRNAESKNNSAFNSSSGVDGLSLAEAAANLGKYFDPGKTSAYQNTDPLFAQAVASTGLGARRA